MPVSGNLPESGRRAPYIRVSEATFEKHVYGKASKRSYQQLEEFDPRPVQFRGTAKNNLPSFLDKVRGEQLCISLLLDPSFCHDYDIGSDSTQQTPTLPSISSLKETIAAFKLSLSVTDDDVRAIEQNTREQRDSPDWCRARRFRLTSSLFGAVLCRKDSTPPDSLVMRIIQPRNIKSAALEWGVQHETIAIAEYMKYQHQNGHDGLVVAKSGFLVSHSHPFLGASPDGAVYDPTELTQPYGFLEVKCPYSCRNISPTEACSTSGFFCTLETDSDGSQHLHLKSNHAYFAQIQGQMGIGDRPWCDFVVYTLKGISVSRVKFDNKFWEGALPKLVSFYNNCVAPEIVSPVHTLGIPIRDLSKL